MSARAPQGAVEEGMEIAWWCTAAVVALAVAATLAWWRFVLFFRDPERVSPKGNHVVAPADGRVVYVKRFVGGRVPIAVKARRSIALDEITREPLALRSGFVVGIYLAPWNVHVNRAPISGTILKTAHHPPAGRNRSMAAFGAIAFFLGRVDPRHLGYLLENERNVIVIAGAFPVCLVQIGDAYVRRVECWREKGTYVEKGERLGMIRMGSQVDVIFPDDLGLRPLVRAGDAVRAGETVLTADAPRRTLR